MKDLLTSNGKSMRNVIAIAWLLLISGTAASADSIKIGEPFSQARKQLLFSGWMPVKTYERFTDGSLVKEQDLPGIYLRIGYVEVQQCTEGLAYCIFNYAKKRECFRIITRGERNPIVASWDNKCPDVLTK